MNEQSQDKHGYGFGIGLLAGACVGAGLALWFVPRAASELRERAVSTARGLGQQASDQLDHASAAVSDVRDEFVKRSRVVRDDVADAVVHGASEVGRFADAAKGDASASRRTV